MNGGLKYKRELEKISNIYNRGWDDYSALESTSIMFIVFQLKGIVNRHQLPINDALIVKMIERLDPHGTDSVR